MRKYAKAVVNLSVSLIVLLAVIFLLPKALVFFAPFVVGWIIALIASPLVHFLETRIKIRRRAGSVVVIILVIALVILVLYGVGSVLVEQLVGFITSLPQLWTSMESDFTEIGENLTVLTSKLPADIQTKITDFISQIGTYVGELVGNISLPTITVVGNVAKSLPGILIGVIMALLSSYLFVVQHTEIGDRVYAMMPEKFQRHYNIIKRSFGKAVGGYFKAQLRIELWVYLLLVIGLAILQIDYCLLIALGIAFLDFIPVFGTGTILCPWAVVKFLSGDYQLTIGLLVIWGLSQLVRQMIQPRIVGDSMGMAPLPTLFLLYIGFKLGGIAGMIVAVPIGLIVVSLYEEGAFETTKDSLLILIKGINNFRRLNPEDLEGTRPPEKKADKSE